MMQTHGTNSNAAPHGTLFVVATPIGNMEDITIRAIRVLSQTDWIAAEDTRHTGKILSHHNIKSRLISCHEHNEDARSAQLVQKMLEGDTVALVCDAGTPTVSDPGFRLVKAAIAAGIRVVPIPGPSAAAAALCASGLPSDMFFFVGFLPKKAKKRQDLLQSLQNLPATLILYESPLRVVRLMGELLEVFGDREAVLARELTKRYEEFFRGRLSSILDRLRDRTDLKGECTLLIHGFSQEEKMDPDDLEAYLQEALAAPGARLSSVVKKVSQRLNIPKNRVYETALGIQEKTRGKNGRKS